MNDEQLLRYHRHLVLPEVDIDGQQRLLDSHVLIVGAGGLGSPVIQYLAASGVGRLSISDDDAVELSNLQRQVIHGSDDIGTAKVESAKKEVARLNPDVQVCAHRVRVDDAWLEQQSGFDAVVDCSDNIEVRYAIDDWSIRSCTPWVSGAAVATSGQVMVFDPRKTGSPRYRTIYPHLNTEQLSCAQNGVLSPLVGVIGSMQALLCVQVLLGCSEPWLGLLQRFDLARGWQSFEFSAD